MTSFVTRPYTPDDLSAVTDVMNSLFGGDEPFFAEAEIGETLTVFVKDPERDTRVVTGPDGAVVAVAAAIAPPAGGTIGDLFGGVHPDWRRRGLGTGLFGWQLDRLAEIRRDRDPDATWQAQVGTEDTDTTALALYARFGLAPVRYFYEMTVPTADVVAVPEPDGLRITPYEPALREAVYEAHETAFLDHWGHDRSDYTDWVASHVDSELFRADLSRIALDGTEIAGYVLAYDGVGSKMWAGQVGTARAYRRRGIAGALLSASIVAAHQAGIALATLGVDSANPSGAGSVYERIGFRTTKKFVVYETELAPAG